MSEVPYYQLEDLEEEPQEEIVTERKPSPDTPYLAAVILAMRNKKDTSGMSPAERAAYWAELLAKRRTKRS